MYSIVNANEVLSLEWDVKADNLLMLGCADTKVKVWSLDANKVVAELETSKEFPCVIDLAVSPTDARFVSASATKAHNTLEGGKGELILWSLHTGKRVHAFHIDSAYSQVNSMVINHNGTMVVTGCADGGVRVLDLVTGAPIMGWPAHEGQVTCVRFLQRRNRCDHVRLGRANSRVVDAPRRQNYAKFQSI